MFNKVYEYFYRRMRRVKNKAYGYVYLPNYNTKVRIVDGDSNLYNEFGEKLDVFFIRDKHYRNHPYRDSRYFMWDRYNIGLKTHFYSHESMLETMGSPDKRYGFLTESPAIVPKSYKLFDKFKGLEKDFDLVFTYSEKILKPVFMSIGVAVYVIIFFTIKPVFAWIIEGIDFCELVIRPSCGL